MNISDSFENLLRIYPIDSEKTLGIVCALVNKPIPPHIKTNDELITWIKPLCSLPSSPESRPRQNRTYVDIEGIFSRTELGTANYSVNQTARESLQIPEEVLMRHLIQSANLTDFLGTMYEVIDQEGHEYADADYSGNDYDYEEHESSDTENHEVRITLTGTRQLTEFFNANRTRETEDENED